ncbi:hypothetical protein ACQPYK_41635 [Streptosporangium sp. CA-135522]|uniref:hypothetical protein n=1 Tax=Streptosporangium sp. CA-135522 TaxID=3240072 RepID=UPI003D92EC5F
MPQPLLGQHTRGELIAELYDRHAAGLFAYCHDQIGDPDSAAAALVAVLTAVPDVEPPRAALYAFARREIYLRDVRYAPPAAVADTDPVAALVERVLRDLRPHQREVLFLSGVCEMDTAELSWVLDVAADTADELTVSACRRFAQSLNLALASARVPDHLTDAFGALAVAPVRDVLVRAPWATPPAALRVLALGSPSGTAAAPPAPPVKPLWPTTPAWPLPLAEADALTGTGLFTPPDRFPDPFSPADLSGPFSAPDPDAVSAHEATTEPMPKLKDAVLTALDDLASRPRRPRLQRPRPRGASVPPTPVPSSSPASPAPAVSPLSAPLPADILDDVPAPPAGPAPLNDLFRPLTPEARAALAYTDKLVASAPREEPIPAAFHDWPTPVKSPEPPAAPPVQDAITPARPALPGWPLRAEELDDQARHDQARHGRAPSPLQPDTDQTPSPQWPDIDLAPRTRRPKHAAAPRHAARPDVLPPAVPESVPVTVTKSEPVPVTESESESVTESVPEPAFLTESEFLIGPASGAEPGPSTPDAAGTAGTEADTDTEAEAAEAARPRRPRGRSRHKHRPIRRLPRHHDWMWELIGFLICVTIAMIVFFAMPTP